MIISKTPFRVSFLGGGTDLREVYGRHGGAVLSATIDQYLYVTVHKAFDDDITVKYSKTEKVKDVEKIEHPIVREALRLLDLNEGLEIASIADLPSKTGLGGSSTFTVGLLNALHAYKGEFASAERLAREAVKIERDLLKQPAGKQDQYAAAYGGFNFIKFNADDTVSVEPLVLGREMKRDLEEKLLFFYTGLERSPQKLLAEYGKDPSRKEDHLKGLVRLAEEGKESFANGNHYSLGRLLHKNWELKKKLAQGVSDPFINECYEKAVKAGAEGGKILGAGGGGFFMFYCAKDKQEKLRDALRDLREMSFSFEGEGSKIIYAN